MSNPDLMRQMILSNPQMQQLMEVHTDTKPDLTPQTNSLLTYFLPHLECNIYIPGWRSCQDLGRILLLGTCTVCVVESNSLFFLRCPFCCLEINQWKSMQENLTIHLILLIVSPAGGAVLFDQESPLWVVDDGGHVRLSELLRSSVSFAGQKKCIC